MKSYPYLSFILEVEDLLSNYATGVTLLRECCNANVVKEEDVSAHLIFSSASKVTVNTHTDVSIVAITTVVNDASYR